MKYITLGNVLLYCCYAVTSTFAWREFPYSKYKDLECSAKTWEKYGCVNTKKPFVRGELLVYWRYDIEWAKERLSPFTNSFVCACAEAAKKANVHYFGIHFWGECFALNPNDIVEAPSGDCSLADGLYKTHCGTNFQRITNNECLAAKSYYLYRVIKNSKRCYHDVVGSKAKPLDTKQPLTTLESLGKEYNIKFQFQIQQFPTGNASLFTTEAETRDIMVPGVLNAENTYESMIPNIYMAGKQLMIVYQVKSKRISRVISNVALKEGKWYKLKIKQKADELIVKIKTKAGKTTLLELDYVPHTVYKKLHVMPPSNDRVKGSIRKLTIMGEC